MTPESMAVMPVAVQEGAGQPLPALPQLEQVRQFVRASKAENTIRGYATDWRGFTRWCELHRLCPLPAAPETVAVFVAGQPST